LLQNKGKRKIKTSLKGGICTRALTTQNPDPLLIPDPFVLHLPQNPQTPKPYPAGRERGCVGGGRWLGRSWWGAAMAARAGRAVGGASKTKSQKPRSKSLCEPQRGVTGDDGQWLAATMAGEIPLVLLNRPTATKEAERRGRTVAIETPTRIQPKSVHLAHITGPLAWIEVGGF